MMKTPRLLLFLFPSFLLILLTSSLSWALTVHEWGTFTSMVGADGQPLSQLHHEEEPLPFFVNDLARLLREAQGESFNPDRFPPSRSLTPRSLDEMPIPVFTTKVTQKMETPVLYFYLNEKEKRPEEGPVKVKVQVAFPGGLISQWFPQASSFNKNDEELKNGHATWDIEVLKELQGDLPITSPESIWNPSRQVNSHLVRTNEDLEKFIFYRGLGDFSTPLTLRATEKELLLQNGGGEIIENGYLVETNNENQFKIISLGSIAANGTLNFPLEKLNQEKNLSREEFLLRAHSLLQEALTQTGLFSDEAKAMVETWSKGYFLTPGLRLLYIIPPKLTEEILPLTITPQPEELKRTLVGRMEILTPQMEKELLENLKKMANLTNDDLFSMNVNGKFMEGLGHFPGPKLERLRALVPAENKDLQNFISNTIDYLNTGVDFR